MTVIETVFTSWQSLGGGGLIGVASVLLMLFLGRIMGATGILAGLLTPAAHPDLGWRLAVLLGMISGPVVVLMLTGQMPVIEVPVSMPMLLIVGALVGIGVTYGSGCTSGVWGLRDGAAVAPVFRGHTDLHADDRSDRFRCSSRSGGVSHASYH